MKTWTPSARHGLAALGALPPSGHSPPPRGAANPNSSRPAYSHYHLRCLGDGSRTSFRCVAAHRAVAPSWIYGERRTRSSTVRTAAAANAASLTAAATGFSDDFDYLGPRYNAQESAEYWALRPATVANRLVEIGVVFGRWRVAAWMDSNRSIEDAREDELPPLNSASAAQLREVLTQLGPAFVKIGQAIASRPDLLPPAYQRELEKLQDEIPGFPTADALAVIEEDFGCSPSEVFSSLTPEPVAAASLGQVYRGTLKASGESVAVKVQRPGVEESISLDMYLLRRLSGAVRRYLRTNTDLPTLLDEWGESLFRELDYMREARNGTRFRRLFGHLPDVYVPVMREDLTTPRVLVMEWVEGTKLRTANSAAVIRARGGGQAAAVDDSLRLVEVGVRCSLEQMLEEGFYHADPHPGNLLRMPDGRLAYLDFGMMGEIGLPIRRGLIRATLHLVNREYLALADDFMMLGLLPPDSNKEEIVPAITGVFQEALKDGVANLSFGQLSGNLGRTMYKFKFRIPRYYTLLVRSLAVLEGIALASDPDYKVLASAYPWIARRLLTDTDPVLRETLESLLYRNGKFQFHRLESLLVQAVKSPARAPMVAQLDTGKGSSARRSGGRSTGIASRDTRNGGLPPPGLSSPELRLPVLPPICMSPPFSEAQQWLSRNNRTAGQEAPAGGPLTNGSIQLILSNEGEFVRNIILEEISRGVDAALRLQLDGTVQGMKDGLLAVLGVPGREDEVRSGAFHDYPGSRLVEAVLALPRASEEGDREQIDGLIRLARQLQSVVGPETSGIPVPPGVADRTMGSIAEAAALLRWLGVEIGQLPAQQQMEAAMIPAILAQKVSSRITARTIRATLAQDGALKESIERVADVSSLRIWADSVAPDTAGGGGIQKDPTMNSQASAAA